MDNQKIINLLDNAPSQPPRFRLKTWFEVNEDSRGTPVIKLNPKLQS